MSTFHLGRAAELRVASELLLRGVEPMLTIVDRGVDLMLRSGTTIQVKAVSRNAKTRYVFVLSQYRYKRGVRQAPIRSPDTPDYYVFWAVDDNRWFVVPEPALRGKNYVSLNWHSPTILNEFEDRWDLLTDDVDPIEATADNEVAQPLFEE